MSEEPRKLMPDESDSVIEYGLSHNKDNLIAYKGNWYPKGWFEKALDSAKLPQPIDRTKE